MCISNHDFLVKRWYSPPPDSRWASLCALISVALEQPQQQRALWTRTGGPNASFGASSSARRKKNNQKKATCRRRANTSGAGHCRPSASRSTKTTTRRRASRRRRRSSRRRRRRDARVAARARTRRLDPTMDLQRTTGNKCTEDRPQYLLISHEFLLLFVAPYGSDGLLDIRNRLLKSNLTVVRTTHWAHSSAPVQMQVREIWAGTFLECF